MRQSGEGTKIGFDLPDVDMRHEVDRLGGIGDKKD
jgi:hypothetical protein